MLNRIEAHKVSLRKSERKVADVVLGQPSMVIEISIAALARHAGVSEPTVIRFCHAIGCKGFQDFKLRLAQSLVGNVRYFHHDVLSEKFAETIATKVFDLTVNTLMMVRNHLDEKAMQKAVGILANATRIEFYGIGASGVAATYAQHKFLLLGLLPTTAQSDPYLHGLAAPLLKPGNAVVAISDTGEEPELLHTVELARKAGAHIIGITAKASLLAERCSVSLCVDTSKEAPVYRRNTLRIAQLVLIDALEAAVALRRTPGLLDHPDHGEGEIRNFDE
jgi:RpiR family carbohydrate utilization transcriptional regulator